MQQSLYSEPTVSLVTSVLKALSSGKMAAVKKVLDEKYHAVS